MILVGENKSKPLGCRLYKSVGDRRRAVAQFKKKGYNYFTGFKDSHPTHKAGLSYGKVEWVGLFVHEVGI